MKNKFSRNIFVDKLSTYQSANSDPKSLKENFVVRINEFELIISALKSKKKKDPLQHELILGRRGSGKSTLLRRIEIEINEDEKLIKKYIPVNLAEEQAGIYRLMDLWFECINELQRRTDIEVELISFSKFDTDQQYTRYLFDEIKIILSKVNKKAVLLLDNIDRIFENFQDDGHLLREILLNHNNIQIIGATTRMDEHFWKYDQPFYEFFRTHHLEALTFDEINTLLNHWSKIMNLPELMNFAHKHRGKIEAIRILTDGLPRTLQFFIRILLTDKKDYGFQYIKKIMDNASPLYQERLNNLSPPQRKIIQEMAFIWEATPTKHLVDKTRMESKLISAYLKQLISYGIVEKISTKTKNNLYRISERFFNMWLIVTQGNPEQKRKAKYLTIFLENWYDKDKIRTLADKHISELKKKSIGYDKAKVTTKALAQSKYISTATRDQLIENTFLLAENKESYGDLPRKSKDIIATAEKLFIEKKYRESINKLDEIENENDGYMFFLKALVYETLGEISNAEKYYQKSSNKGDLRALTNLGNLYNNLGNKIEAEKYYLKAVKEKESGAMFNLANLYRDNEENEKAEKYYLQAIEKDNTSGLHNLAILYQEQDEIQKAIKYYLKAIEKGNKNSMNNLGILYQGQGEIEPAEKYYLQAIEKDNSQAIYNLALLYHKQKNIQKAEKYYIISIENGNSKSMNNLAFIYLMENQKPQEALNFIKRKNQINSDFNSIQMELIINVWNNIFDNLNKDLENILDNSKDEDLTLLIKFLLYFGQNNLVLSYFESEKHGKELQNKYILLYYAILILTGKDDGKILKIPEEVLPTVESIIKDIEEKNEFYLN